MSDITIHFAGAPDAISGSAYKIERSLNNADWTVLAAAQAATTPYVSPTGALSAPALYGASELVLESAASLSQAGYGYLGNEALVQWNGNDGTTLSGVRWYSGYGTYALNTDLVEAHEDYTDVDVTPTLGVVLYRITHINSIAQLSAPAYLWYFDPPVPESSRHCVVIVGLATDLGHGVRPGIEVTCQLATNDQLVDATGQHLGQINSLTNVQNTNAFGLAFFQCWKSTGRVTKGGAAPKAYTFNLDGLTVLVGTVPDRDWVLLEDIANA